MKTKCIDCGSSDACEVYEDGARTHCFSCNKTRFPNERTTDSNPKPIVPTKFDEISDYNSYPISSRGISKEVVDYFNVKMSVDTNGKPESHFYPYTVDGKITKYKERKLPKEGFFWHGSGKIELCGQAQSSGSKTLVIVEGEIDMLSVGQAFYNYKGRIYPVVSLPSSTGTNTALEQLEFINSFQEVIVWMDNDAAGKKAEEILCKMIAAGKAKIVKSDMDANDLLMKDGSNAIMQAIWGARSWSPAGIVVGEQVWEQFKERQNVESVPYPECLDGLNKKLKGIRHGEITLFTSGTGSGKSTVIKEIILDLLDKTEDKIGLISLEESVGDTAEKFIAMALKRNILDPPAATEEELRDGYERVFGDERFILLDHQGSVGDSSLINKIEYMALMGCKYLVLDHITIAVSEGADGLSGNEAVDKMMSDLLKVCKKHNVWLGLISHLRKSAGGGQNFEEGKLASIDDIKGSGSIKQISFDIISFARNLVAEDEQERNTIHFRVLKSRYTGFTGDAGAAAYDVKTTRLKATGHFDFASIDL